MTTAFGKRRFVITACIIFSCELGLSQTGATVLKAGSEPSQTGAVFLSGGPGPAQESIPNNGLQAVSISLGYTGSAQRDENAKGSVVATLFQGLDVAHQIGSYRGTTSLTLSATYDDKWKSTPDSSNVTQLYQGLLTESILTRRAPRSACDGASLPYAYQVVGDAYHNNSQGIRVDQSYGFGVSKTFVFVKSPDMTDKNCPRSSGHPKQALSLIADLRSVNYSLYSTAKEDHGIGTRLELGYSRTSSSGQAVGLTVRGVPVYSSPEMSRAEGDFIYLVPVRKLWAITFNVQDDYYQIAPKTFNKNYVAVTVGLKFTPPKPAAAK